jgi:hypothetical protein
VVVAAVEKVEEEKKVVGERSCHRHHRHKLE